MMMKGLLCLILAVSCQGKPSAEIPSTPAEYYSDDYYSADDDYLNEHEKVVYATPTFVSTTSSQMINEGDTIKLPCLVDKLDGFVLLWKKGKDIVAVGSQLINKEDNRVKLEETENGNTLVISLAEPDDAGEYTCQISASRPTELRHSVQIRVAPQIRPVPHNGHLVVYQGDSATLSCDILKGNPTPEITWKRKERKMPSGEEEIRGLSITFSQTTRHHSGIYTCSADNGFGFSANATIVLDVQHAPVVEQEQTFIHTREYDETEVICTVHASPKAEVVWFRDGIPMTKEQGIFSHRGNRHSLLLPGIRESTFGIYKCKATNKFGSDERTTEVSGQAAPANFKSDAFGTLDTEFHMEWVTESITPITTFKLQYKSDTYYNEVEDDESSWKEVQVTPQVNGDHFYSGRHTLTNLSSASRYVARVASKNNYGYSKYSQPFRFATKGAAPVQQPSKGGSVQISASMGFLILSLTFVSIWQ